MRYTVAKREEMLGIAPLIIAGIISAVGAIGSAYMNSKGQSAAASAASEAARLKAESEAKNNQIKQIAVIGGLGVASIAVIGFMFS